MRVVLILETESLQRWKQEVLDADLRLLHVIRRSQFLSLGIIH